MAYKIAPIRQEFARKLISGLTLNGKPIDLTPELEAPLFDAAHEKAITGGVQAGKSVELSLELTVDAWVRYLTKMPPALYWLVGETYGEATDVEFSYCKDFFIQSGLLVPSKKTLHEPENGEKSMQLIDGTMLLTKSASNPERLRAVAPDKIAVCEAGTISDDMRRFIQERAMRKYAQITYSGTMEDDLAKRQWAWFVDARTEWDNNPDLRAQEYSAYAIPSWANRTEYPGGENDPKIVQLKEAWRRETGSDYRFLRRIAGVPAGNPYQVYEMLDTGPYLREWDYSQQHYGAVGGIDYGTSAKTADGDHLTVLTVVTLDYAGRAWVRECHWCDEPNSDSWLRLNKQRLSAKYSISPQHWGTDPTERWGAQSNMATAMSGSAGATQRRINAVRNRLSTGQLLFDIHGPGIYSEKPKDPCLWNEMRAVHYRKQRDGQMAYHRFKDDRTQAVHYAIEMLDSFQGEIPRPQYATRRYAKTRPQSYARV